MGQLLRQQNLTPDLLEEVRMLSNLETDQHKLMQIVLSGQPELGQKLANPGLRQLRQRITIRCIAQSGGSGTLTPASPTGFLTVVLAAKGQGVELEWNGAAWFITALVSLTGATPTVTMA